MAQSQFLHYILYGQAYQRNLTHYLLSPFTGMVRPAFYSNFPRVEIISGCPLSPNRRPLNRPQYHYHLCFLGDSRQLLTSWSIGMDSNFSSSLEISRKKPSSKASPPNFHHSTYTGLSIGFLLWRRPSRRHLVSNTGYHVTGGRGATYPGAQQSKHSGVSVYFVMPLAAANNLCWALAGDGPQVETLPGMAMHLMEFTLYTKLSC